MDISELLAFSVKNGASDLHVSAGEAPMIRINGDMTKIKMPPIEDKQVQTMVYDIMNDSQRKHFEEFLDLDFSFSLGDIARFRVNCFWQNRGMSAVFRTIPTEILTLEQLNAPEMFKELAMMPRGICL
ncbi:MAG: twitching motility protein PilT, partial [Ghiorsea sp.]|nr:twitching motility protein PilT [Ghiorsea sp.]